MVSGLVIGKYTTSTERYVRSGRLLRSTCLKAVMSDLPCPSKENSNASLPFTHLSRGLRYLWLGLATVIQFRTSEARLGASM
jgi:hypothetical protein